MWLAFGFPLSLLQVPVRTCPQELRRMASTARNRTTGAGRRPSSSSSWCCTTSSEGLPVYVEPCGPALCGLRLFLLSSLLLPPPPQLARGAPCAPGGLLARRWPPGPVSRFHRGRSWPVLSPSPALLLAATPRQFSLTVCVYFIWCAIIAQFLSSPASPSRPRSSLAICSHRVRALWRSPPS